MLFVALFSIAGVALVLIAASYFFIIFKCDQKAVVKIGLPNCEKEDRQFEQPIGPHPWPIIGNLDLVGRFNNPFEGFGALTKHYGDIYSLTLGHTRCLIVNNLELIREVLNKNGKFFGGRPDFLRYHKLFGGDRNNCKFISKLLQKRKLRLLTRG